MRMQEGDNTRLVHTTINRRWNHPLVAVAAAGQERREISGVRKGRRRLTMAAPVTPGADGDAQLKDDRIG